MVLFVVCQCLMKTWEMSVLRQDPCVHRVITGVILWSDSNLQLSGYCLLSSSKEDIFHELTPVTHSTYCLIGLTQLLLINPTMQILRYVCRPNQLVQGREVMKFGILIQLFPCLLSGLSLSCLCSVLIGRLLPGQTLPDFLASAVGDMATHVTDVWGGPWKFVYQRFSAGFLSLVWDNFPSFS